GQILLVGEGLDLLEVTAQLPIGGIEPLLPERPRRRAEAPSDTGSDPDAPAADTDAPAAETDAPAAGAEQGQESDPSPTDTSAVRPRGRWFESVAESISATVHLRTAGLDASWPAKFSRFTAVDPTTRTSGVLVQIDREQRRSGN